MSSSNKDSSVNNESSLTPHDNNQREGSIPSNAGTDPVTIPSSSNRGASNNHSGEGTGNNAVGSSASEDEGNSKRQRTTSSHQPPFISASPPGFVTLEEIMKAANSVSKMALAHDIAVDEDFHLEKVDLPSNSIQKKMKEICHQAFWDVLKEELESDPPSYERALILLEEIRDWLLSLLLPHQTKTQQEIKDHIDIDLIRQQIEAGSLDMHSYSQYIVSLMARLCAPGRDDKIRELTALRDLVPLYKGIFETLELMRIDMANFTIAMSRPHIAACSVEYERLKFDDYLKITPDGLRNTREWLLRNEASPNSPSAASSSPGTSIASHSVSVTLINSFMELLKWDDKNPWPETMAMDEARFSELRNKLKSVEVASSILLVSLSQNIGPLQSSMDFRISLKEHIAVVLGSAKTDQELVSVIPNVASQVVQDISKALKNQDYPELTDEAAQLIISQINDLRHSDNRVRLIIHSRLMEFLRQVISSEVAKPTQIPAGLSLFKTEIAGIAGRFARLVSHNRAVFAEHYANILKEYGNAQ